jgi:hypothetical protein
VCSTKSSQILWNLLFSELFQNQHKLACWKICLSLSSSTEIGNQTQCATAKINVKHNFNEWSFKYIPIKIMVLDISEADSHLFWFHICYYLWITTNCIGTQLKIHLGHTLFTPSIKINPKWCFLQLTLSARHPFQNFSTGILNVNNIGAKQRSIMK